VKLSLSLHSVNVNDWSYACMSSWSAQGQFVLTLRNQHLGFIAQFRNMHMNLRLLFLLPLTVTSVRNSEV
jgi:hypothetical protein